jgi:adenylate cyclase
MRRMDLREFLRQTGASDDEIELAAKDGVHGLQMLATDRVLLGGTKKYTGPELAKMAGVEHEVAKRYWRALGFVDVPDDEIAFTDMDAAALQGALTLISEGLAKPLATMQIARVMGQALSRVAEAQLAIVRERIIESARAANADDEIEAERIAAEVIHDASKLVPINEAFLSYVYRRHMVAASNRLSVMAGDGATSSLCIGFCDLVGFTAMARRMEEDDLGSLVERFESTAYDVIGANRGRLVKMIGDEVMFVADAPRDAAEIALLLSEAHTRDKTLPDVRVGLAYGAALPREGDYFGDTVNLANRVAAVAMPRTILVSEAMAESLDGEDAYELRRITRHRYLKGLGRVRLWALRRAALS